MLVLSRKVGEEICIGNDIVIRITKVQGGGCRVGVKAPKDVTILRGELRLSAQDEAPDPSVAKRRGRKA